MRVTGYGVIVIAVLALGTVTTGTWAASQMSESEYRATLETCKKEATPQLKDECVSNARNRYERGMGAEKKSDEAVQEGKKPGKADMKMKGGKAKGAEMLKSKGKK